MARSSNKTRYLAVGNVKHVVLIGCGGTGSIVAEHLCRMIAGFRLDTELILYDGDTVEEANIKRQNFVPYEVGTNKAQALALRLTGQFSVPVAANAEHITSENLNDYKDRLLFVSCTDTLQSRRIIAETGRAGLANDLWLDTGNEQHHGQVIIGNTYDADILKKTYNQFYKKPFVQHLPNVAAMYPAILKARKSASKASCAAMPFAIQGFGINAMSALAAAIIAKQVLVDGQVKTAAIYFNVSDARMQARRITRDLF
ncbi:MAG: ThiF family adenylyltransferase, partial [Planctomycetes bacterium]|nr:ThiF family adenylyltransferase [Planctomycetota bacterium]